MSKEIFKILSVLFFLCAVFAFQNCSNDAEKGKNSVVLDNKQKKEYLERANKYLVSQEKETIDKYIENRKIDMVETGTGLRYRIVNQGDGEKIKTGDIVSLDYEVRLLNDDLLYSSDETGRKIFVSGRGGVESGLEEAVLLLHKGDEAEIIIPSHLAHGLLGDGDKIPPRTTIVYKVKVVDNQINN